MDLILGFAMLALPVAFCLTVHEYAHARSALALGDPTAKNQGRCRFDPIAHIDPIGLIAFFVVGFGWAKPVPVDPSRLRHGRMGHFMVSGAGIAANLASAIICAIILRIIYASGFNIAPNGGVTIPSLAIFMLAETLIMSLALCFFNLIPLFPLDGYHMLCEIMPDTESKVNFMRFQMQYGHFILLGLLIFSHYLPLAIDPFEIWFDKTLWPTALFITGDSWDLCYKALERYSSFSPF